jgi:hypothetical protein
MLPPSQNPMIGSCFVLNSKSEPFEANVFGKALLKYIGSSFATEVSLSKTINLAHGLAVTQRILCAELSQKNTRSLVQSLFNHLISSA